MMWKSEIKVKYINLRLLQHLDIAFAKTANISSASTNMWLE